MQKIGFATLLAQELQSGMDRGKPCLPHWAGISHQN